MSGVTLNHVSKTYPNGYVAVKDASLDIRPGEFVVLVGPSGCGKSTLLRMIAGLETVSGGEIAIGGRVINDVAPRERNIAMVFQNYALYPHMTVAQNLGFALRQARLPADQIRSRVDRAAQMLGLEDLLKRKPKELSGGQRQRVAVGRAIVRDADVFLFDEPLSNLDASLRTEMRTQLTSLHKQLGKTMIYVTHDQVEAMTMADRIVVLKGGDVIQVDTPLGIYRRPNSRFVAEFIGSPAMNFVPGHVRASGQNVSFTSDDGVVEATWPIDQLQISGDQAAVLGVRPEDIRIGDNLDAAGARTSLTIDLVETMGHEVIIHGTTSSANGQRIISRGPAEHVPARGQVVTAAVDTGMASLFCASSGRSLLADNANS